MADKQVDKIWYIREADGDCNGELCLVFEDSDETARWQTPLPLGGDWDRTQITKLFRKKVPEDTTIFHSFDDRGRMRLKQLNGNSSLKFALVMGTKEGEKSPAFINVIRNVKLCANEEIEIPAAEQNSFLKVDRIDLVAETASKSMWGTEGSYPNKFTFVVSSVDRGLLVSECFSHGPHQVMEAGVCGRFEFRLAFPVRVDFLREKCRIAIKAKAVNAWMPRHVLVLGVSRGKTVLLGGRLNLDQVWMSTRSEHVSFLELDTWSNRGGET